MPQSMPSTPPSLTNRRIAARGASALAKPCRRPRHPWSATMPITIEQFEQVVDRKLALVDALGLSPAVVEVFAVLGSQCYEQGRYHDARSMFQAAVALDEGSYMGHAGLGALALV